MSIASGKRTIVMWRGPSRYDGKPIMVIITPHSDNPKTGDMAQVSILRADISPEIALRNGGDFSVCGSCLFRPGEVGGCYTFRAVNQNMKRTWHALRNEPVASWQRVLEAIGRRPIRIGAYGDPAAVPVQVWLPLITAAGKRLTAYTHGHRFFSPDKIAPYASFCMMSVETLAEAERFWQRGWRTYRIIEPGGYMAPEEALCPYEKSGLTCYDCLLCDGALSRSKSIVITVHGSVNVIGKALRVIQGC